MQSTRARATRARALAIALGTAIAGTGCAELAPSVPALRIEALAIERRDVDDTGGGSRWSWAAGVGLASGLGAMPRGLEVDDGEPERALVTRGASAPCRRAELCAWEARARTRALARLRGALTAEGAR